jgi:hypothetical protein
LIKLYVLLAGGFLAIALGQTLIGVGQLANSTRLPSQFGFNCTTVGSSTSCEIDRAYILHLEPVPFDGSAVAPRPGPCPTTGSVIVTNEPAAYFCVAIVPGGLALNWIRVQGQSTW